MDVRQPAIADKIIKEIEANQKKERRIAEWKAYKVAEGGQREFVIEQLAEMYPKTWQKFLVSDVSLSNKVISKLSKAYKEKPIRDLGPQTDRLEEIFSEGSFDRTLKEFDRDFNRQRYGMIWVRQIEEGKYQINSMKGFETFQIFDPVNGKLKAVVISYPDNEITVTSASSEYDSDFTEQMISESQSDSSADKVTYAMWTDQFHAVWEKGADGDGAVYRKELPDNPDNLNKLGRLPFVWASMSSSTDLPFLNQITEQSITWNVLNTTSLTAVPIQGFGQLILRLPEKVKMQEVHAGMFTAITIPLVEGNENQGSADYINPGANLGGMRDTVKEYAMQVMSEHGLDTSSLQGQEFNSGIERLIASADASDKISANQQAYSNVEKEIVEILKAYGELGGEANKEELSVKFPKAKVMISDKETLENIGKRKELGLISDSQALMIIDPNLDTDQAREMLDDIDKEEIERAQGRLEVLNANKQEDQTKLFFGPDQEVGEDQEREEEDQGEE